MKYPYAIITGAEDVRQTVASPFNDAITKIQIAICMEKVAIKLEEEYKSLVKDFGLDRSMKEGYYIIPDYELDDVEKDLLFLDAMMYLAVKKERNSIEWTSDCGIRESLLKELGFEVKDGRIYW